MDALGWAVVNRVGDREFGATLDAVIHKKNAFQPVQDDSPQWRGSADPDSLAGPNARAWQRARDTAQGILDGTVRDPIDGAPYFFNWPEYNGTPESAPGDYRRMLGDDLIAPVYPPRTTGTANYFFNRNPYPPKNDSLICFANNCGDCLLVVPRRAGGSGQSISEEVRLDMPRHGVHRLSALSAHAGYR
jgi:hypothetical protein